MTAIEFLQERPDLTDPIARVPQDHDDAQTIDV
jgi:hypothetical protein